MLAARSGFVGALLLGLGAAFGWWPVDSGAGLVLHLLLGAVFAYGIFVVAAGSQGAARTPLWLAAALTAVAILLALGQLLGAARANPYWHPLLMVLALGAAEMGSARARRSPQAQG